MHRHLPLSLFIGFLLLLVLAMVIWRGNGDGQTSLISPAIDSLHVVAEIDEMSELPGDPTTLDYADCTSVWRLRVIKQTQGRPLPSMCLAAVQVMADRQMLDMSALEKGDFVEVELRTPGATPEERVSMKRIDGLLDFELPLLHAVKIQKTSDVSPPAEPREAASLEAWTGGSLAEKADTRSAESRLTRQAQIQATRKLLDQAPENAGFNSWEEWESAVVTNFRPMHKKMEGTDEGYLKHESEDVLFRRMPGQEFTRLADEGATSPAFRMLLSLHEELDQRAVDLIVVPFPGRESVHGDLFLSDPNEGRPRVINPARLRFYQLLLAAGIEVIDLVPALQEAEANGERVFYDHSDPHPNDLGVRTCADLLGERLKRYQFEGDGHVLTIQETTFSMPERHVEAFPRLEKEDTFLATQVFYPWGKLVKGHRSGSRVLICGDSFARTPALYEVWGAGVTSHLARRIGFTPASNSIHGSAAQLMKNLAREEAAFFSDPSVLIFLFQEERLLEERFPSSKSENRWEYAPLP